MICKLVATSGLSMFAPGNLGGRWLARHGEDLVRLERVVPTPLGAPEATERAVFERWRARRPALGDRHRISAEFSVFHALEPARSPEVVLLHSDTFADRLAAALLSDLLEHHLGAWVYRTQFASLDTARPHTIRRSLADFVRKLSHALSAGEPNTTAFAPIGGCKVVSALGYLVGSYHGYPSVHLHEDRHLIHRTPPVPIRVDEGELHQVAELIRRTRDGAFVDDPEALREIDARPWLFERDGEAVFLNTFGELLRNDPRYRSILRTRIFVTDPAVLHEHQPFSQHDLRLLLDRLERPLAHRDRLSDGASFGHHDTPYKLYRGASGGRVFRTAYHYDEPTDVLRLRKVWIDTHSTYEREARAGAILGGYDGPWHDVSDLIWSDPA